MRDRWYIKLEVIFVDDKSKDNSKKAINDFANTNKDTKLLMNKNIGAIRSVYRGITISKGDCILSMAADLQDPFNVVLDLVESGKMVQILCCKEKVRMILSSPRYKHIALSCIEKASISP